ncbi:MAG: tripartite tricarboxylate transporter substrate binding protein [Burkholderiales bacterium]
MRLVIGFAPGGGNDILARLLAEKLKASLGQSFIVENHPGANGFIAAEQVKRAAPDGYTLLVGPSGTMVISPALYTKLPFDPVTDFAPVSIVGLFPLVLAVHPSVPARTTGELIALAQANPGKLNYSSPALGFQLATELFAQRAGIVMNHIPYKGGAPAVNAAIAGEVSLTFADSAAVMPQVKAGRLRALAVSSARRLGAAPELPTLSESGMPGFSMGLWSAIFAPAGTSTAITQKLQQAIAQAVASPDLRERLTSLGVEPVGSTAEELAATMKAEIAEYRQVAKTQNIRVE